MKIIEWTIKNQNAKYKFGENPSKETSINISKEIFDFLGGKQSGDIVEVQLRKKDFLLAFSKIIANLPLYYFHSETKLAEFNSDFFEAGYKEIFEHFADNEIINYPIKLTINDKSTIRYYIYRKDGLKNFVLRDFLIGENSKLKFIKNDENKIIIEPVIEIKNKSVDSIISEAENDSSSPITHKQIIFYGVPGCGKSYSINSQLEQLGIIAENKSERTARVVFHPEYTNADFVGQILPKSTSDGISYPFTAGSFTQILEKAYNDKNNNYALIIEEINRGNAAAIFGDLFQLLDRFENGESEKFNDYVYGEGWSSYCVNNDNIANYIMERKSENSFIQNFNLNTGIRLPPNLSLFATMNTSDQNVFKLDNAFKRRWNLKMIPNEFDLSDEKQINQCNAEIEGFDFTWGEFRLAVNKLITEDSDSNSFSDKQLGTWFVKNVDGKISSELFANKVLEYLWDDVFNFETEKLFNSNYKTLASVIADIGKGIEIFNDKFKISIENAKKEINEKLGTDATN